MSSTIILNVAIWKWNGEAGFPINGSQLGSVIPNCFICLHNGFITRISSTADQIPSLKDFDNVIDGKGRLVLPGLIGIFCQLNHSQLIL